MMRVTDTSSHDRQQLLAPAALALGTAGATEALLRSHGDVFRPYFGSLHPLLAITLISLLGIVALRILSLRWKFKMYAGRESWKGMRNSLMLATLFAVVMILVDWHTRLPYSHVPPPQSFLFYPVMAFVAEVMFHAVPLAILLIALGSWGKARDPGRLVSSCVFLSSCLEPIFQVSMRASEAALSLVDAYVGLHVYVFNLLQLVVFRRYDFVSMFAFRLIYYLYWHVTWGWARPYLLSA
jgi:hypothetical protein